MAPADPIEFFRHAKLRSHHKHRFLGDYIVPMTYKIGSQIRRGRAGWKHIWIIDGFAGRGAYLAEDGGKAEDGSPLITAKWARRIALERHYDVVRCINVERDPRCYSDLERELTPWRDLVTT